MSDDPRPVLIGHATRRPVSGLHRGNRTRAVRALLADRDGLACRRCGQPVDLSLSGLDDDGPNVGHVTPRVHGGSDALANLGLEHRRCNLAAGARPDPPRATLAVPVVVQPGNGRGARTHHAK